MEQVDRRIASLRHKVKRLEGMIRNADARRAKLLARRASLRETLKPTGRAVQSAE